MNLVKDLWIKLKVSPFGIENNLNLKNRPFSFHEYSLRNPKKFRTQGSFIHINRGKIFERDLISSDSVAKSATLKPWVFRD